MAKDGNFTFFVYCLQCFDTVNWAAGRACKKQRGGVLPWLVVCSDVQICIWPSRCHCHPLSLASAKSRLVLPFWYRLTRVVPDTGPLNVCVCACVRACVRACVCVRAFRCQNVIRSNQPKSDVYDVVVVRNILLESEYCKQSSVKFSMTVPSSLSVDSLVANDVCPKDNRE